MKPTTEYRLEWRTLVNGKRTWVPTCPFIPTIYDSRIIMLDRINRFGGKRTDYRIVEVITTRRVVR